MIRLGLRDSPGAVDSSLISFVDELLSLLVELLAAYRDSSDAELLAALEDHRQRLVSVTTNEEIPSLAESCLGVARTAVSRARNRQSQQHADLAHFVALVRDTVTVLGGQGDDPSAEINDAADRFRDLLELDDIAQLKARLGREVQQLKTIAEERKRQWHEATASFMTRVAMLERQLAGVREEASLDPLTKIGNRRHFESALADHLRASKRHFVIALFDLDDFKRINDTGGHQVGDRLLQDVAMGLKASVRPDDVVARIGGDEFAMVATGLTLRQADARMRAVIASLSTSIAASEVKAPVTLSCGVAECSAGDTMQSLIGRADQALYDAKRKGKNRVVAKAVPFIRDLLG